jgi:alkyl hydroperoxide reductase subunit AhpC
MFHTRPKVYTGSIAPNFESNSASEPLIFHQWIEEHWSIVFSLPGSSFLSDLTEVARSLSEIEQRNIRAVGFSRNWLIQNSHWNNLLQDYSRQPNSGEDVKIIADDEGKLSSLYGMLSERDSKSVVSKPNTVFLIDPTKVIRLMLAHPASLSTGLSQILRFVDENSGPLQDIPTETFGLDVQGTGKIYNDEVKVSNGGIGATDGIVETAVGVINQVKDASGSDESSSSNVVSAATDYIQHAITVMDTLADIGKVMPFVAPAFVIIKTIIAVEQRARDVDTKCTDLVQRVTFMLSHLPALKKIQVTDTTRQVLDRMNDTLKKAAALIQAYRKQSAIARRLSVHNKDRFVSCASSLKECTNDLMTSLQIHQSTQLDILTRPVPSDPEDEAAEKFIAAHGGMDVVKGNKELVKQFGSEMKLSVDDNVMEQLNTNLSAVLQENQDRLEKSLNESVSASVVEGIRSLATQMNESAKEQTFICVQCDKEYRESTSGEKSCSFHRAGYDVWGQIRVCCGSEKPCQVGRHRSEHHCDYPYAEFFYLCREYHGSCGAMG